MDIITPISQAISPFTGLGLTGMFALLCFVVVVGGLWIGYKITSFDSRRDKSNADLSQAQLKIMAAQQSDISNTNKIVSEALLNSNRQFEEFSKNSNRLSTVIEKLYNTQVINTEAIAEIRRDNRADFNSMLDRLQSQESILLEMSKVVAAISKDFAEFRVSEHQCAVEWKNTVDTTLNGVRLSIKELVDKQRESERATYVEKEFGDLIGGL